MTTERLTLNEVTINCFADQGAAAACQVTIPAGTRAKLTGAGWAVDDIPLLVRLTGNRHDPHYRYVWLPKEAFLLAEPAKKGAHLRLVPKPTKAELERRIAEHGYALRYVEYCEDARTPGFAGLYRGVTDRDQREVKIGRRANPTEAMMLEVLAHELRHLDEPEWDCGCRDVFGRGGPAA